MAASKAQQKANQKYDSTHYIRCGFKFKPEEIELINNFSQELELTRTRCIVRAVRYCIENGIDLNNVRDVKGANGAE